MSQGFWIDKIIHNNIRFSNYHVMKGSNTILWDIIYLDLLLLNWLCLEYWKCKIGLLLQMRMNKNHHPFSIWESKRIMYEPKRDARSLTLYFAVFLRPSLRCDDCQHSTLIGFSWIVTSYSIFSICDLYSLKSSAKQDHKNYAVSPKNDRKYFFLRYLKKLEAKERALEEA